MNFVPQTDVNQGWLAQAPDADFGEDARGPAPEARVGGGKTANHAAPKATPGPGPRAAGGVRLRLPPFYVLMATGPSGMSARPS